MGPGTRFLPLRFGCLERSQGVGLGFATLRFSQADEKTEQVLNARIGIAIRRAKRGVAMRNQGVRFDVSVRS